MGAPAPVTPPPSSPAATPPPASVEAWLLDHSAPLPPAHVLRARRLAAYAYAALPPAHPARPALRADFASAVARHHAIKLALLPLLRAWTEQGVEVMLYKGFHLGEMVYPVPGARFYGDVDVLIRPARAADALRIAREGGWTAPYVAEDAAQGGSHALFTLSDPARTCELDVHRLAVHAFVGRACVQERITRAVWDASEAREWEGIRVRHPSAVDALLVGMVLQRCWSGDGWAVKPHDGLDFRLLTRHGVTRTELEARAEELRCRRTLAAFLSRCDPDAGRLTLAMPAADDVRGYERAARGERPAVGLDAWRYRLRRLPRVLRIVPRGWRELWRVRRLLSTDADLRDLLRDLTPRPATADPAPLRARLEAEEGIRLAARIFPRGSHGPCVLRSLALYAALRRRGWPAVFVSGVRRHASGVVGHAWVELDGRTLPSLHEKRNRELFAVTFVHPPEA
jgi:hypothetical protein